MEALAQEFLDIPEYFNSDDELSDLQPAKTYNQGMRTCEQIFKHAIENRVRSKQALMTHQKVAADELSRV